MKNRFITVTAAVSLTVFGFSSVLALELPNQRIIQVSGTAESSLSADQVEISAEVRVEDPVLGMAQKISETSFERLVESLKEIEVSASDVSLEDHSLGKNYRSKDGEQIPDGFYSEREFKITLKKADSLEAVYTKLAQAKGIKVRGTVFSRKDEIEIRNKVRTSALEAASEKATAMAKVYGQKIGKVLTIKEGNSSPFSFNTRNTYSNQVSHSPDGASANGKVAVTASVEVVFELVD